MATRGTEGISDLNDLLNKKGYLDEDVQKKMDELREVFQDEVPTNGMDEKDLIEIRMNPILKETVDLGGAEMMAGVYNVLGTAFVSMLTKSTAALALAGPVIEKIGFFIREAIKAYRAHNREGTPFSKEFKANISNGIKNLIVDITMHDSIYTSVMAYGLTHEMFSATLLSFLSFLIALPPAILMKYSGNELLYFLQKQYSKFHGFKWERYYEARFILNNHSSPHEVFEELSKEFGLGNYNLSRYNDTYYHHHIPSFSDRIGTVKFRHVDDKTGNESSFNSLEIAHTIPTRKTPKKESVYNYFYSSKEKGRKWLADDVDEEKLLKKIPYRKVIGKEIGKLAFDREMIYDNQLRITLDQIVCSTNSEIQKMIEFKVYDDEKYLIEAMDKVMRDRQIDSKLTTHPKIRFFEKK